MFAIAFDLDTAQTGEHHPKGVTQAYADIRHVLAGYQFEWTQGSLYLSKTDDLTNLFDAIEALRRQRWFPASVRDIRAFRVEQWSDFTATVKRASGPYERNENG